MTLFPQKKLAEVTALWGITLKGLGDDRLIAGSPERTAFRAVFESAEGELFVLEQIFQKDKDRKTSIARALDSLFRQGLISVLPYKKSDDGEYLRLHDGNFWQMTPFVEGVALDRTKYYFDQWRAPLLSAFLVALRGSSDGLSVFKEDDVFDLIGYIRKMLEQMQGHHPNIRREVEPIANFVDAELMPVYKELPVAFCHGDYHPLNIIWGERSIRAVIDWEFCGYKPEIYDVANMVGCLGMENPDSLDGKLVTEFLSLMRKSGIISEISWDYFDAFVLALRFAWLAEWLRKKDAPMIDLELDYMYLLMERQSKAGGFSQEEAFFNE